jgi:hypothetical protein
MIQKSAPGIDTTLPRYQKYDNAIDWTLKNRAVAGIAFSAAGPISTPLRSWTQVRCEHRLAPLCDHWGWCGHRVGEARRTTQSRLVRRRIFAETPSQRHNRIVTTSLRTTKSTINTRESGTQTASCAQSVRLCVHSLQGHCLCFITSR